MSSGAGVYFDGVTSARREVGVELGPDSLRISAKDGDLSVEWPYNEVEELDDALLRLEILKQMP